MANQKIILSSTKICLEQKTLLYKMKAHFLILLLICSCQPTKTFKIHDNFEAAKSEAQIQHKKILIIFDLFGASINHVDNMLNEITNSLEQYVVVRLMCDDRKMMNDSISVGEFNTNLQLKITGGIYQPMYCVLDYLGNKIAPPIGHCDKASLLNYIIVKPF
jgi:hypothetical protein